MGSHCPKSCNDTCSNYLCSPLSPLSLPLAPGAIKASSDRIPTVPPSTKCNFLCWILKTFSTMSPFWPNPILLFVLLCVLSLFSVQDPRVSLVAQMVKNLPAMQEMQVWSLGWENPLEKGMATHSNILAWRIPKDRGAWQATVHRAAKSQTQLSS